VFLKYYIEGQQHDPAVRRVAIPLSIWRPTVCIYEFHIKSSGSPYAQLRMRCERQRQVGITENRTFYQIIPASRVKLMIDVIKHNQLKTAAWNQTKVGRLTSERAQFDFVLSERIFYTRCLLKLNVTYRPIGSDDTQIIQRLTGTNSPVIANSECTKLT
jgi:hypothetical protein